MTQTRWESLFKPASYGPVVDVAQSPARTLVDVGDQGPADLAATEVRHYLAQDSKLRAIFRDRIERLVALPVWDFRRFPRLAVYLSSMTPSERPTATSVELTTVYVGTMWDAKAIEVLRDGQVSIATPLAHIKRVLRAERARVLAVWKDGSMRQLAHNLESFGRETYGLIEGPRNRKAYIHEIPVEYRLHVDRGGQLVNLM